MNMKMNSKNGETSIFENIIWLMVNLLFESVKKSRWLKYPELFF